MLVSSQALAFPLVLPETTSSSSSSKPIVKGYYIPDLVGHFDSTPSRNPHGDAVAAESDKWLDNGCPGLSDKARKALYDVRGGLLSAFCYTTCDAHRLRVSADFINYLFHLDDISDGLMTNEADALGDVVMNALWLPEKYKPSAGMPEEEISAGRLARDFWSRCIVDGGPGFQARFKENLQFFFAAVHSQTLHRQAGEIPDLESYIDVRRDESGVKPCLDLLEYALAIDLPDCVIEDQLIRALKQDANDVISWSNDIFSFNVEQARDETHNIIIILQAHHGMTLQEAMDYTGELCRTVGENFKANMALVPSFGCQKLDNDVAAYVQGLQDWIVGSLHWSFMSRRYFGTEGAQVKGHLYMRLLPKKKGNLRT